MNIQPHFASLLPPVLPLALCLVCAGASRAQDDNDPALPAPAALANPDAPIPVLLISGANNHDWNWTAPSLRGILEESGRFAVTVTNDPAKALADAKGIAKYRAFVLDYNGPRWGAAAEANFVKAVENGTGVAVVHAANNAFPGWVAYENMVALMWRKGTGHGRFHAFDVKITDRDHPLTRDMPDMRTHPDELYHRLVHMHDTRYHVLATALSSKESGGTGEHEPMILVKKYGKGRIFHTPLGHVWTNVPATRASHADPQFRQLIARGTEWAATGAVTLPGDPPNFLTAEEKKDGFRLLFNGRDFDGWRGFKQKTAPKGWEVRHAAMTRVKGGGDIMTDEQFGDFDLRFEWKVSKGANSGVIYRVRETQNATYNTGPEYQVLDDANARAKDVHTSAALYDMVPPKGKTTRPTGQYNTGRVVIRDGTLQHWMNGTKVLECPIAGEPWKAMIQASKFRTMPEFGVYPSGHIALQEHGAQVWYRSIRIKTFN